MRSRWDRCIPSKISCMASMAICMTGMCICLKGAACFYDWGVHLIDQVLWMVDAKVTSVFATMRNVINFEVDDYFNIQLRFSNGIMAEIELGTYYLSDKKGWFERHWFLGGNKGSAYADGFFPEGKNCSYDRALA